MTARRVQPLHPQSASTDPEGSTRARRGPQPISPEELLDSAYELFLSIGPQRMTIADVARHAKVSRATLYRRWPNVERIVAELMTREWVKLFTQVDVDPDANTRRQIVDALVSIARATRVHPMWRVLINEDPDFLVTYLLKRRGASTDLQLQVLEKRITRGQQDGSIRPGDPRELANALLLTATSFVVQGPTFTEDLDSLDRSLDAMLDRFLLP